MGVCFSAGLALTAAGLISFGTMVIDVIFSMRDADRQHSTAWRTGVPVIAGRNGLRHDDSAGVQCVHREPALPDRRREPLARKSLCWVN